MIPDEVPASGYASNRQPAVLAEMFSTVTTTEPAAVKPPRLNFAGYCAYCQQRGCQSPRCVEVYERSVWLVCGHCKGTGEASDFRDCGWCLWGVIETHPGTAVA